MAFMDSEGQKCSLYIRLILTAVTNKFWHGL